MGVDGGATRIRSALADSEGRVLAEAEGGAALVGAGEDQAVADRIVEQVRELVSRTGDSLPVDSLCAGLAGVAGRSNASAAVAARIREATVAREVCIVADYEVAFLDAFGRGPGILLIAGTGSVAVGRSSEGPLARIGGWGALIGDEGSGYQLGLEGLRSAVRASEGRQARTSLTDALFHQLGVGSAAEVFEWSKRISKGDVAALAPRVIEEADRGDEAASRIVSETVEGLVQHARALARKLELGASPAVALVGGLVEPGGLLRERALDRLERAGFMPSRDPVSPVRGAVSLALGR